MNRLTGAKLSIVSPKAQTTRFRVLGILMRAESQVLLVDTPGIFRPKRKLDRAMVAAAWTGAADADVAILLVDARSGRRDDVRAIAERLGASGAALLAGAEQDRPGDAGIAVAADRRTRCAGEFRGNLHGQRADRRRRSAAWPMRWPKWCR